MTQTKLTHWLIPTLLIFILVLVLPGRALADGIGEGVTVTSGGYQVTLAFAESLKLGENSVHVRILDALGLPVTGALIEINALKVDETQQHQQAMQNAEPVMDGNSTMPGMNPTPTQAPADNMPGMASVNPTPTQASTDTQSVMSAIDSSPTPAPADGMSGMSAMDSSPTTAPLDDMAGMPGMDSSPTQLPSDAMSGMDPLPTQSPVENMTGMAAAPTQAPTIQPTLAPTAQPTMSSAEMPGMASAPAAPATGESATDPESIRTSLHATDQAGEYDGDLTFSAAGHWMLSVHITQNGQMTEVGFPLDVPASSTGLMVLSGFAGFNIVIIAAAALTKRRPVAA